MTPVEPQRVIDSARTWLGTPYHHQASVKGAGCDCLGLLRGVWRDVVGPEVELVPPYTPDWGDVGARELLYDAASRLMIEIPVADVGPGAAILFRMRRGSQAKHCGIVTGPNAFIHSYSRSGVVEEPFTALWRRRVRFAFLFPMGGGV